MSKLYLLLLLLPVALANCPVAVILSKSDICKYVDNQGNRNDPVFMTPHPAWTSIPDARWVWSDYREEVVTKTFEGTFILDEWKREYITSLALFIAVDNSANIYFNGERLSISGQGSYGQYLTYELKDKYLGATQDNRVVNKLTVDVYNAGGPGGLIYKIIVAYH